MQTLIKLSDTEKEVLKLAANGLDNNEIAELKHLSLNYVKEIMSLIYKKFNLEDCNPKVKRTLAVVMAIRLRIIEV